MDLKYIVKDTKYTNLRTALMSEFNISARLYQKLKKNGNIYINGCNTFYNETLSIGDILDINLFFNETSDNVVATNISLNILYEDKYLLILNKPANMPVHPSMRHFKDTLSNGVQYYFAKNHLNTKIRIVNRLDKDTSGIVIFAKCEYIQDDLILQMKNGQFKKEYLAIVEGTFEEKCGTISASISRKDNSIIERCVDANGQSAITHYDVIKEFDSISLVHFVLETGRTHQIRVHSQYIGHPILGDTLYGTPSPLIDRQALHAYKISIIHPLTKEILDITAPLPNDMENIIKTSCP